MLFCKIEGVEYDSQEIVGPWTIKCELLPKSEGNTNLLKQKAIQNFESFMTGQIHYYLEVLETEDEERPPLVFIESFTKATRPPCWKNADLRIESTLPLLGIDTAFVHDNPASCHGRYVKISIALNDIN